MNNKMMVALVWGLFLLSYTPYAMHRTGRARISKTLRGTLLELLLSVRPRMGF